MIQFPKDFQLMYGTAWKEDLTAELTYTALKTGFRAIDTANQRKHYNEPAVGEGISRFLDETGGSRESLFVQTKFTYERGQDHRMPYDPRAPFSEQVVQSFESSLKNLQTSYVDSYILHGPHQPDGFFEEDREVWKTFESLHSEGYIRHLGISNLTPLHLRELLNFCEVKPKFVQNRCFARFEWDRLMRELCQEHEISYQGFSLLTANAAELNQPRVLEMARLYRKTVPQLTFRFTRQLGMLPLTGTTNSTHMAEDLGIGDFEISPQHMDQLERIFFL